MSLNTYGGLNVDGGAVVASPPQGVITLGVITKTDITASISFTYSDSDQAGFEYRVNSGTVLSSSSPILLTGLVAETTYSVEVRAVNATGSNAWTTAVNFTTDAAAVVPVAPVGVVTIGAISVTETSASVPFTYDNSDQDSFEYQVGSGAIVAGITPISITGLVAETAYTVRVRAVNATGSGNWSTISNFTTDAVVAVDIAINLLNIGALSVEGVKLAVNGVLVDVEISVGSTVVWKV